MVRALIGRLADRFGKVPVYRIVASVSACLMLVITNLGPVPLAAALGGDYSNVTGRLGLGPRNY